MPVVLRRYIADHWRGRHSLARSFWINFAMPGAGVLYLERFMRLPIDQPPPAGTAMATGMFFAVQLVLFGWQAVGVLRACDRSLVGYGSIMVVWGAQAGVVLGAVLTAISIYFSLLPFFPVPPSEDRVAMAERLWASRYAITMSDGGSTVHINGSFERGITEAFQAIVDRHGGATRVILNSEGGSVHEGRRIARLIESRGLHTHVDGICKSACATAFAGGAMRTLGAGGRLGFHRFALDHATPMSYFDVEAEQRKELDYFASRGIKAEFLRRVFERPPDDIWLPTPAELLAAGVVHRIE